jgi:hypothetical protein
MNELFFLGVSVGMLGGIAVALVICRFIPQRVDIDIHLGPGRPPNLPPEPDSSEAWKGGQ